MFWIVTYLLPLVIAATFTVAAVPFAARLGLLWGLVEVPGIRKLHATPVAITGGIAIYLGTLATIVFCIVVQRLNGRHSLFSDVQVATFLICASFVFAVGFIDDFLGITSRVKLFGLIAASVALCSSGIRIHNIIISSHIVLHLGLASWPVTVLWLFCVTLSINCIDGLDGLAAGVVAIAGLVVVIGAVSANALFAATVGSALVGASCGFLFYNTHPARVRMGNAGSMFLGFTLAALGLVCAGEGNANTGVLLPAIALAIPLLDAPLTFVRRGVLQRRSSFAAEREYVHQRLVDMGIHQRHAVLLLCSATALAGTAALIVSFGRGWQK